MNKKKPKKKLSVALSLIVVAVVAVVAGVYYFMSSGGPVARASSLQFNVTRTYNETTLGNYLYMAKNVGESNMALRIETNSSEGKKIVYIVNGAQRKAWVYSNDKWQDFSDAFTTQRATRSAQLKEYTDKLKGWSSGDLTYTASNGDTVKVYNIAVDPSFADSVFEPS